MMKVESDPIQQACKHSWFIPVVISSQQLRDYLSSFCFVFCFSFLEADVIPCIAALATTLKLCVNTHFPTGAAALMASVPTFPVIFIIATIPLPADVPTGPVVISYNAFAYTGGSSSISCKLLSTLLNAQSTAFPGVCPWSTKVEDSVIEVKTSSVEFCTKWLKE